MNMSPEDYLEQRVERQIDWYDSKSESNQRLFKTLRMTEIVIASIIPFVAGLNGYIPYGNVAIGLLGIMIAICAGILTLNKYQENWLMYRTTCETLRHEKHLFLTGTQPYSEDDKFDRFVSRVESLISKENSQWARAAKNSNNRKLRDNNG